MEATPEFDVFLSHSSGDKTPVAAIAEGLRSAGLHVFLDVRSLTPGAVWQTELEDGLARSGSAVVFFGATDGPWRDEELRVALDRAVRSHDEYRVIPVLLPGASEQSVPAFLRMRTWVDFRTGIDNPDAL